MDLAKPPFELLNQVRDLAAQITTESVAARPA
jgi:hypothetical protein